MEKQIAINNRKTWLLITILVLLFLGVALIFVWLFESLFLGSIIVSAGLIYLFYTYKSAVRKIIKFSGAQPARKTTHRQLYLLVENMSIQLGIAMPEVYVIDTPSLNAFAAGYNPNKALIGVTSGLLEHLNKQELEGVIAHEMSHIVNHDTKIATLVFALLVGIALMLDMGRILAWFGAGDDDNRGNLIVWLAVVALTIVVSILGYLLQAAISRRREYMADHTGASITRYPEGLAAALRKIQAVGSEIETKRESAVAHLFLNSPVKAKKQRFLNLFSTHPPLEDRIAALEELKQAGL